MVSNLLKTNPTIGLDKIQKKKKKKRRLFFFSY